MWRTFFLSVGISLAIFGGEFLLVEKATWSKGKEKGDVQKIAGYLVEDQKGGEEESENNSKDFKPQPWVPWAMLSSGAIIILYCSSITKD